MAGGVDDLEGGSGEAELTYTLTSGERGTVRFALPAGLTIGEPELTAEKIPVLPLEKDGRTVAALRLVPPLRPAMRKR